MATLFEFYEKDFANTVKIFVRVDYKGKTIEGRIYYDFSAFCAFSSFYFPAIFDQVYFREFLENLKWGQTKVLFDNQIMLPDIRTYDGDFRLHNTSEKINPFKVESLLG